MATVQNDDSLFEGGYDTDTISLTSTVASDHSETALYDVEEIISEYMVPDDEGNVVSKYLTKWVGYPLHKCTWEPVEHLENTNLLEVWDKKFVELGEAAFTKLAHDNHVEYEAAVQHVAAAKAHRQRLRAKKRQMLESSGKKEENTKASPFIIIDSDSDSDTPLMNSAGASHGAHFTRETRPPRRQVLQPSKSLDSEDSKDPLMKQLRTKDSEAERRKPPQKPMELIWKPQRVTKQSRTKDSEAELLKPPQKPIKLTWNPQRAKDQSGSLKRSEKRSSHATESSSKSVPEKLNDPKDKTLDDESRPSRNSPTRTCISSGQRSRKGSGQLSWQPDAVANAPAASTLRQNSKAVGNTSILALRPSSPDQVERPKQFMRKSAPTIRMLNEPKTGHLKAAWHKGGVQETYSKIRYRRKAELRGRHEATPDPSVLLFVNAPPGLTPRRSDQTNGNPYGRRDPVDLRAPRPNDSDDEFAAPSTTNVSDLEKDKVPLTCFDWRNGSCPYNAETCRFLHRDTAKIGPADGVVPPKYGRPKITCSHWMRGKCWNTEDNCGFAHYNTGWLVSITKGQPAVQIDPNRQPDPPDLSRSLQQRNALQQDTSKLEGKDLTCYYWMRNPKGCIKPETQCPYAHQNTGWLLRKMRDPGPSVVPIDPTERPLSMKSRSDPQVNLREAVSDNTSFRDPGRKTCYFWHHEGRCNKRDSCRYEHYDTGAVADPPRGHTSRLLHSNVDTSSLDLDDDVSHNVPMVWGADMDPASLSCLDFEEIVGNACKLNFGDMFGDEKGGQLLAPTAFLMFNPRDHTKELELITRWLHLHHVEVRNVWVDGAWEHFKQNIVIGGTGVILAHPDFRNYSELPDFGQVLRRNVRIWSVGVQNVIEYDPNISTIDPPLRYDCIEVFPRGGIIYITDDIFEEMPVQALEIIELFIAKVEQCRKVTGPTDPSKFVDDGYVPWRLATRPGLMESIWKQCLAHEKEVDAQDPVQSTRAKLYELLHRTGYVERDHNLPSARSEDYFPIISERPDFIPEYKQALRRSQDEANTWMVQMYAGFTIDYRRHYRQYYVVHTNDTKPGWKETCQNLSEVITPDRCIEYFRQSAEGPGAIFDFYEWAFTKKDSATDL